MYDPLKANILRISDNTLSSHRFTYIYIEMSLDIPYWYEMTDSIAKNLNFIVRGGSLTTNNKLKLTRLLQDDPKAHEYKNCKKMNASIKKKFN